MALSIEQFISEHGGSVRNSMEVYISYMREEAGKAMTAYTEISADPERRAAQDASMVTTHGLKMSAKVFEEAAARTQKALTAWTALTEAIEDAEDEGQHYEDDFERKLNG